MSKRRRGHLSDEAYQRDQLQREKDHARQMRDDLYAILSMPPGRRWLYDHVMRRCQLMGGAFAGEDTHVSAFHEGRRSVGLELMKAMQTEHPQLWALMVAEGSQADATDEDARKAALSRAVTDDGEESADGDR